MFDFPLRPFVSSLLYVPRACRFGRPSPPVTTAPFSAVASCLPTAPARHSTTYEYEKSFFLIPLLGHRTPLHHRSSSAPHQNILKLHLFTSRRRRLRHGATFFRCLRPGGAAFFGARCRPAAAAGARRISHWRETVMVCLSPVPRRQGGDRLSWYRGSTGGATVGLGRQQDLEMGTSCRG